MIATKKPHPPVTELLAVHYLSLGWSVIPVEPRGKRPVLKWEPYQRRKPSLAEVREWLTRWPEANLGIVTGAVSGLVVVDLDGEDAVREFLTRWGDKPLSTPVVRTGKGVHVYFRHPGRPVPNRVRVLGMDIRGDGGFVVAPGSVHESGHAYRFLLSPDDAATRNGGDPLLPMPEWLAELLDAPPATVATPADAIPEGERNATLYRLARSLKARGLAESAVLAAVHAENTARCRPPLPESEVTALVANALTQPDRPRFADKATEHEKSNLSPGADPIAAALHGVINVRTLSDVEPEEVSWLWPEYLSRGKLTLLVGDPEGGKSFLSLDLAARLTSGQPWPDDAPAAPVARVLLLQAEDGAENTVRPRLDALGGNATQLIEIRSIPQGTSTRLFSLKSDVEKLRPVLSTGLVGLLIIDPLTAYLGEGTNTHRDADVRRVLAPLADLAAETGVAVLAVMHLNKNEEASQGIYRVGGSIAFPAVARQVLAVHTRSDGRRVLSCIKDNLGPKPPALAFHITGEGLGARLEWDGPLNPEEAKRQAVKRHGAIDLLRSVLARGPVSPAEVKKAAKGRFSEATLDRARTDLGVVTNPRPGGGFLWSLPTSLYMGGDDEGTPHHQGGIGEEGHPQPNAQLPLPQARP